MVIIPMEVVVVTIIIVSREFTPKGSDTLNGSQSPTLVAERAMDAGVLFALVGGRKDSLLPEREVTGKSAGEFTGITRLEPYVWRMIHMIHAVHEAVHVGNQVARLLGDSYSHSGWVPRDFPRSRSTSAAGAIGHTTSLTFTA